MLDMSKETARSGSLIHLGFVKKCATLHTVNTLIGSHPLIVGRTLHFWCCFVMISWSWINMCHDFGNPVICSKIFVFIFIGHPLGPIHESLSGNFIFSKSSDRPSCKLPLSGLQYLSLLNLKFSKHYF